jgi:hypothetical protein
MDGTIAIIFFFSTAGFVIYTIVTALLRSKEIGQQAQVMIRLVDQVGTAGEAAAFLESDAGRRWFQRLVDRRTLVLQRVLLSVQSAIVLGTVGVACLLIRTQVVEAEERFGLMVVATLGIALALAFLLAAASTYFLSQRWGLLEDRTATG